MEANDAFRQILAEMKKRIAGNTETIELMFTAIVANGHTLMEGMPGLAKTTMTKALAGAIEADFKRVQGTPDLEPRDIIGNTYLDEQHNVKINKGPVFTNILLVDELNRTPPKTMSAFLETLEERQVTLGGVPMALPSPFIAFAVQNPLKIEGTEPIPKVLADRFMMKIDVDYPSEVEEQEMLRIKENEAEPEIKKIIGIKEILDIQSKVPQVEMPEEVMVYITELVDATRKDIHVTMGASPRAAIAFMQCGKARALIQGRKQITKDDIKFLAKPVLSHRITVRATGGVGVHGMIDGIIATLDRQ